jgi:hypothetical protein
MLPTPISQISSLLQVYNIFHASDYASMLDTKLQSINGINQTKAICSFVFTVHLRHSEDILYVKKHYHSLCFLMGFFFFHNPANDSHIHQVCLPRAPMEKTPNPLKRRLGSGTPPPPPHTYLPWGRSQNNLIFKHGWQKRFFLQFIHAANMYFFSARNDRLFM